jgi:hypothetical protein
MTEFSMDQECSICLECLQDGEIKKLKCKHVYHNKCIYGWSITENSCPECRLFFDFDTSNQNDFLKWLDRRLYNFNKKYCTKKERLLKLVEIVNTTLRLNDKDVKCPSHTYREMLNKIRENENDLNYSCLGLFCNWFGDDYICEYGWYEKTIKQLEILCKA